MQIRVLGCSTADMPNVNLTSFLLDNSLLIDAGTILSALDETERLNIAGVFISHAHLDHVKDLPFFAESALIMGTGQRITVISIPEVTAALRENIFNNVIWPDYTKIPSHGEPTISFRDMQPGEPFHMDSHTITAYKVNHTVPAVGYLIEDRTGKRLLYAGDAGPSNSIWKSLNGRDIHGLIIEVSFPDNQKALAIKTGHLTPSLLVSELAKMETLPDRIFITHCKPQFKKQVVDELSTLNIRNISILACGAHFEI